MPGDSRQGKVMIYCNKEKITGDITVVPLRELSYEDTKKEIIEYLEIARKRTVYVKVKFRY